LEGSHGIYWVKVQTAEGQAVRRIVLH
jgi:hypothetical protein